MILVLIFQRTRWMSICHYMAERTYLLLKISAICHLSFLKTKRLNILDSHLPLNMIIQIMRMLTKIVNFFILVVMISLLLHPIAMFIHSLLICLSHRSMMIYLSKMSKPRILSRHLRLTWWLCQALAIPRLVFLLIRMLFKHKRLLITLFFSFKINLTLRFHFLHSNYMIPLLMHYRNLTKQLNLHNVSGIPFSSLLSCHNQENAYTQHSHMV